MKLSSPLFVVLSSVVSTILIAAEPCADGYGVYDMTGCNACAENGNGQTCHSICCNALYRHSRGRDDDDLLDDNKLTEDCSKPDSHYIVGQGDCYPGLICTVQVSFLVDGDAICKIPKDNPHAYGTAAALVTSLSSTSTTTTSVSSFVLVAVGAVMIAMKVVRHRVLLRRHQYSEVEATVTRIDV